MFSTHIIETDRRIQRELSKISPAQFETLKERALNLPIENLRLNNRPLSDHEDIEFYANNLKKSDTFPSVESAVLGCWNRTFSGLSLIDDIVQLNSLIMGKKTSIRISEANAVDSESGSIILRYPPAKEIMNGFTILSEMLADENYAEVPSGAAILAWIYLMRLHPFADGNGRTSRAFFNFSARQFGLSSEPIWFLCPIIYANMDSIIDATFGENRDLSARISIYQELLLKYLSILRI